MKLYFDHILHYIDGIETMKFPFKALTSIEGGNHEKLGTFNRLGYIDLHYIEWIDVFDKVLAQSYIHTEEGRLSFVNIFKGKPNNGFKRVCFRTDDIQSVKQHLETFKLDLVGPIEMSRTKPDGTQLNWKLLYIDDKSQLDLPFIIQWDEPDNKRAETLQPYFHNNLTMNSVTIETENIQEVAYNWKQWYQLKILHEDKEKISLGFKNDNIILHFVKSDTNAYSALTIETEGIKEKAHLQYEGAHYNFIPKIN